MTSLCIRIVVRAPALFASFGPASPFNLKIPRLGQRVSLSSSYQSDSSLLALQIRILLFAIPLYRAYPKFAKCFSYVF